MPLAQQVPPIARGYHYALEIAVSTADDGPFQPGVLVVADVRNTADGSLAGRLSTADGTLYRVDDHRIQIQAPASLTLALAAPSAFLDFALPGAGDPDYLGIGLRLPVTNPATQLGTTAPMVGFGLSAASAIIQSDRVVTLRRCASRATTAGVNIGPVAIPAGSVMGTPSVAAAPLLSLALVAIPAALSVPAPVVGTVAGQQLAPTAITSTAKVGALTIATAGALGIGPSVIASAASVGSPTLAVGAASNAVTYSNDNITYNGSAVTYG